MELLDHMKSLFNSEKLPNCFPQGTSFYLLLTLHKEASLQTRAHLLLANLLIFNCPGSMTWQLTAVFICVSLMPSAAGPLTSAHRPPQQSLKERHAARNGREGVSVRQHKKLSSVSILNKWGARYSQEPRQDLWHPCWTSYDPQNCKSIKLCCLTH